MMAQFTKKGDKPKRRYDFADRRCIGRECFQPGMYQHRSPTASGSRNTGSPDSPCCMQRAYRGCPKGPEGERKEFVDGQEVTHVGLPIYQRELASKRIAEGWREA